MKKWVSLLASAVVAFSFPVSAFATDGKNDVDAESKTVKVVQEEDATIKVDGMIEPAWALAEREVLEDAVSGLNGHYRLLWDHDAIYVLVEFHGAAKAWKDQFKPVLFSMWFNGDDDGASVKTDGYVALTWPELKVYDNGLHQGWFKPKKLDKAFAVKDDDVILEFRLPWEQLNGQKLDVTSKFGLNLDFVQLAPAVEANGEIQYPAVSETTILQTKPNVFAEIPLHWVASLIGAASEVGTGTGGGTESGNGGTGSGGSTGGDTGNGGTGTGGSTGGDTGNGGTGNGGSTGGDTRTGGTGTGGTGTGTGGTGGGGTAVGGVSDEGVIPGDMPQTGGGGASDWTD